MGVGRGGRRSVSYTPRTCRRVGTAAEATFDMLSRQSAWERAINPSAAGPLSHVDPDRTARAERLRHQRFTSPDKTGTRTPGEDARRTSARRRPVSARQRWRTGRIGPGRPHWSASLRTRAGSKSGAQHTTAGSIRRARPDRSAPANPGRRGREPGNRSARGRSVPHRSSRPATIPRLDHVNLAGVP